MDEQHQQVKLLLMRAADAAGPFAPPPVETLTRGRRAPRLRSMFAVTAAAAAVLLLAVGLSMAGAGRHARTTATPQATTLSWPGPTGPAVPVSALTTYRWTALPAAPIAVRSGAASAWTGQLLIVWGGKTSENQLRNDGATYDPTARTWAILPTAPLSARTNALSAWVGGSFIVWGGGDDRGNGRQTADGARYDPRTGTWTTLPSAPISSHIWAALVTAGNEAVLLSTPQDNQRTMRADAYDPATNTWRPLPDLESPIDHQLLDPTVLGVGDTVLVWSEWYHITRPSANAVSIDSGVDTHALDTRTSTWTSVPLKPDPGRQSTQSIWTGKLILLPDEGIYCGVCSHPSSIDDPGVAIDPQTGARTPIPSGPLSTGSSYYYWTGSALLAVDPSTEVIGGAQHSMKPGDTAAWDPDTNSWSTLSSVTIDGDLTGAVTAWTGTRLLVWGISGPPGRAHVAAAGLQFASSGS